MTDAGNGHSYESFHMKLKYNGMKLASFLPDLEIFEQSEMLSFSTGS